MALQHRILHRLLVSKNYLPEPEDWSDENNTVQAVTTNLTNLKGYFAYHYDIPSAVVDSMLGHPGSIPDSILVEYGVDHEELNELALYIDNLSDYTEDPGTADEDAAQEESDVATTSDSAVSEVDLNEILKDD